MPFNDWDPIVKDVFFGCVFLLPLMAVLWVWYDSTGRSGSGRWYWRLVLTILVLPTAPAVALGAANSDDDYWVGVLGWLAIACGVLAVLGVLAYLVWGRGPEEEYEEEGEEYADTYAKPAQVVEPATQTAAAPAEPPAPTQVTAAASSGVRLASGAYLFVKSGPNQGQQFALGNQMTIGRATGCDITLNDSRVSAEHGQLKRQGDSYVYLDLKSTNGSFLSVEGREERLHSSQTLVDGDEIRLGQTVLKFIRVPNGGR